MKQRFTNSILILLMLLVGSAFSWQHQTNPQEYDTMTLATFQIELQAAIDKEARLRQDIAKERQAIDSLKALLAELDQKIASTIQEKYRILGITEADVVAAEAEIADIRRSLELLLRLSPEDLYARRDEIATQENRINSLKKQPVSLLWRVRDQIPPLEQLLARVKGNLPSLPMTYTVQERPGRRDCLYRIAGFDEVYSDASRWPELYRANRETIDRGYQNYRRRTADPKYDRPEDLIFPGQVLDIPR